MVAAIAEATVARQVTALHQRLQHLMGTVRQRVAQAVVSATRMAYHRWQLGASEVQAAIPGRSPRGRLLPPHTALGARPRLVALGEQPTGAKKSGSRSGHVSSSGTVGEFHRPRGSVWLLLSTQPWEPVATPLAVAPRLHTVRLLRLHLHTAGAREVTRLLGTRRLTRMVEARLAVTTLRRPQAQLHRSQGTQGQVGRTTAEEVPGTVQLR